MKKTNLKIDVFDSSGKKLEEMELPKEIFGIVPNKPLLSQAVRIFLTNQRQGTASSKTRGEVSGSGKKIYKQKGTGRARHGDRYAPIFVGGGVAFGPKPKNWSLKLSQKMKKQALFSALSSKFQHQEIAVVDGLEKIKAKTQTLLNSLVKLAVKAKNGKLSSKTLLVTSGNLKNIYLAGRNLQKLKIFPASLLNVYEILYAQKIIFTKKAISSLSGIFLNKQK